MEGFDNASEGIIIMTDILTIRASGLDKYPDCPRRFAASALKREIKAAGWVVRDEVYGVAAVIGTAVHFAAKTVLDEVARGAPLPPRSVATDAARDSFRESTGPDRRIIYDAKFAERVDLAEKQVYRMTISYHHYIAPYRKPICVEQRFESVVAWARQPMILSGQPDLVARESNDIDDLKTGVRPSNHAAQAGGYALLARSEGLQIDGAKIDFVPRASLNKPQPHPIERRLNIALSEELAMDTLRQIDVALTVWREGDPERGVVPGDPAAFQANPASVLCKAKYCPCHSVRGPNAFCRAWKQYEDTQ